MRDLLLILCGGVLVSGCVVALHGPPAVVIGPKPRLVVIPDTELYYAPDVRDDVFFYDGLWYRWYGGVWYRAKVHSGPWVTISVVPTVFYKIPPGHVKYRCVRQRVLVAPRGRGRGRGRKW
jgi:GNAT superfamily N-acetyltransferase